MIRFLTYGLVSMTVHNSSVSSKDDFIYGDVSLLIKNISHKGYA